MMKLNYILCLCAVAVVGFVTEAHAQTANSYYNEQYMNCLKVAQRKTQYVHASIRDEAMGKMLDACMYRATGNEAYAPMTPEDQPFYEDTYLYSGG